MSGDLRRLAVVEDLSTGTGSNAYGNLINGGNLPIGSAQGGNLDDAYDSGETKNLYAANPTASQGVATKDYVDTSFAGAGNLPRGHISGLVVKRNVASPSRNVDVDANAVCVNTTAGSASGGTKYVLYDINETIDVDSVGAGGLDTGAVAADTNYYYSVIYNPTTLDVSGLLSLSYASPTLPSGYTAWLTLGVARTDGSSNFLDFDQIGDHYTYDLSIEILDVSSITSPTSLDISAYVPTEMVKSVFFAILSDDDIVLLHHKTFSTGVLTVDILVRGAGAVRWNMATMPVVPSASAIYYETTSTDQVALRITGFTMSIK